MALDWRTVDRWLMGEAWTGSGMDQHLAVLCDQIGPRWSSSSAERKTVEYIHAQLVASGVDHTALEEYSLQTWHYARAEAHLPAEEQRIDILPFLRCPPCRVDGALVDVGFGSHHEIATVQGVLPGAVAIINLGLEPFTAPVPLPYRLQALAEAGAAAAVAVDRKEGGRKEYHSASDWRYPGLDEHPLPTVTVSREDGALLRRRAKALQRLTITVESNFTALPSWNVAAELRGEHWPEEHLLLGGHHDTVFGAPGGNDNTSGVMVVLETARVLAQLRAATGVGPGRTIRFVTFSAEEQKLQGATAYVQRHYGPEAPPRLAINLDELATGPIKGLVLAFPHLRKLVQQQFAEMGDGLHCHVMAQLDPSSDHFPFLRAGIDAAHLWRWRFVGRRPDSDFHHEPGDTMDKVNLRELKEYAGQLARLLLRLSHVPPEAWPANPVTQEEVRLRLEAERGQVIRVF
ncbi:MAG: M28 family metallopeptidase [Caldilineaceae bacterium]